MCVCVCYEAFCPKGPAILKILPSYWFTMVMTKQYDGNSRTLLGRASLKHLVFLDIFTGKSPQIVNYCGDIKLLRRSIFNTAGSFGWWILILDVLNRGSRFAVHNDSNRHRFAAISNCTIRAARPKTVRLAVKALLFFWFQSDSPLFSTVRMSSRISYFIESLENGLFWKTRPFFLNPTTRH